MKYQTTHKPGYQAFGSLFGRECHPLKMEGRKIGWMFSCSKEISFPRLMEGWKDVSLLEGEILSPFA